MKKNTGLSGVLWDESYLWGIWLIDALTRTNIGFELIKAKDLEQLDKYRILFVPGGWASNKIKAIGEEGSKLIKEFVKEGGIYFGICGGAGLATKEGLGLVDVRRKKDRVPSFSGPFLARIFDHPLWKGITTPNFFLWWPSELELEDKNIKVLATFLAPLPNAFSSDIPVQDFKDLWDELESLYEIKLNPKEMENSPLFLEAKLEKGTVYLSLIHFDTPKDKSGHKVLKNLKEYYQLSENKQRNSYKKLVNNETVDQEKIKIIDEMYKEIKKLISFCERNFLLIKRYNFMYQWRRGIRGFEYINLYFMIKRLQKETIENQWLLSFIDIKKLIELRNEIKIFIKKATELLKKERILLQKSKLTYNYTEDEEINSIRKELFGSRKSYDGFYKQLIDKFDDQLYTLFKVKFNN